MRDHDPEDLAKGLHSRDEERVRLAVREAAAQGSLGEELLTDALLGRGGYQRVLIASAIGDTTGAGSRALRRVAELTGPGTEDAVCVALVSLVKREGAAATPDLRQALRGRRHGIHGYALAGLAGAGDASARDDVTEWLTARTKPSSPREPAYPVSDVALAIGYLARHAPPGSGHALQLVELLRSRWPRLHERDRRFVRSLWPDVVPEAGVEATAVRMPDAQLLARVARSAVFEEPIPEALFDTEP